jgi:6-phosphogluconolactonase (cycloisomerase 2 family)
VQVLTNGIAGVHGLDRAFAVAVSPDGKHVYGAAARDDAVAVFSRQPSTGSLSPVHVMMDGVDGVSGLDGASTVAVSPDGKHVYAGGSGNAIAVFRRDANSGVLRFVQSLEHVAGAVDGLQELESIVVSPDGKYVYATGSSAVLAVYYRNETSGVLVLGQALKGGARGVDGLHGAHSITVSPDAKHIYVAGAISSAIAVFSVDSSTGFVSFVYAKTAGSSGSEAFTGAYAVAISPDGAHLYVSDAFDDKLATFSRDPATGLLSLVQVLKDGVAGVDGLDGTGSLTVSPNGQHVYVTGNREDAIAVFRRDKTSGTLTFEQVLKSGGGGKELRDLRAHSG